MLKRNWLWRLLQPPVWVFCRLWFRIRAEGLENLDATRGGLLLINHQSFLDPVLAAVLLRRPISYLARDSLFRVPLLGWLLRRTHVIPISRESVRSGSIRTALERLEQGFLVGIFPEGRRSSGTEVQTFHPGFLRWLDGLTSRSIRWASPAPTRQCPGARVDSPATGPTCLRTSAVSGGPAASAVSCHG